MPYFTFYKPSNGEISHVQMIEMSTDTPDKWNEILDLYEAEGLSWYPGDYPPDEFFIDSTGGPSERPAIIAPAALTLGIDTIFDIADIPAGSQVIDTPGGLLGVTDGSRILSRVWRVKGEYTMKIDTPFPWKPYSCKVTIV